MRAILKPAGLVLALALPVAAHGQSAYGTPPQPVPAPAAVQPAPAPSIPYIRPGNDIGTRESLPLTNQATNINGGDTRSQIAPTPPLPNVGPNANAEELLTAAHQALAQNQTGMAQEALEQAESQILNRTTLATTTNYASGDPVVAQIDQALQALGNNDIAGSTRIIDQVLASNAPELTQ